MEYIIELTEIAKLMTEKYKLTSKYETGKGIHIGFIKDDGEKLELLVGEDMIKSFLLSNDFNVDKVTGSLFSQIKEIMSASNIEDFKWEDVMDLLIIIPQLTFKHSDTISQYNPQIIPLEQYNIVSAYAINLRNQVIFLSKKIRQKWDVSDDILASTALKNIKRLIKIESKDFRMPNGAVAFKLQIANASDETINSSAIYLYDNEEALREYRKGLVISMHTRSSFIIAPFKQTTVQFLNGYNQQFYDQSDRYQKLKNLIVFNGVTWGTVSNIESDNISEWKKSILNN